MKNINAKEGLNPEGLDSDVIAYLHDFLPGGSFTRGKVSGLYVNTLLDQNLLPRIVDGEGYLAILSGNAGDGKTAFIQGLLESLGQAQQPGTNIYSFAKQNRHYMFVLDGSEETAKVSNDELLHQALGPYKKNTFVRGLTTVVAVNKGALLSFLERHRTSYPWLWAEALKAFVDAEWCPIENIRYALIDLNERSLFAEVGGKSVFEKMVNLITHHSIWSHCDACEFRDKCPVWWNLKALSCERVISKIEDLIKCIDLDDRLHFTSRHAVTMLLGLLLSGKKSCHEVVDNPEGSCAPFYEYLFEGEMFPGGSDIEDAICEVDPAWSSNPRAEQRLVGQITDKDWAALNVNPDTPDGAYLIRLANSVCGGASETEENPDDDKGWINLCRSLKRRDYFLGEAIHHQVQIPFRYQREFNRILDSGPSESDKRDLVRAINCATGIPAAGESAIIIPPHYSPGSAVAGWGRLVHSSRLRLETAQCRYGTNLIEFRPRTLDLLVIGSNGDEVIARLGISLILYEMLRRAAEGFRPVTRSQKDYLMRLGAFFDKVNMVPEHQVSSELVLYSGGLPVLVASRPVLGQPVVLRNCEVGDISLRGNL